MGRFICHHLLRQKSMPPFLYKIIINKWCNLQGTDQNDYGNHDDFVILTLFLTLFLWSCFNLLRYFILFCVTLHVYAVLFIFQNLSYVSRYIHVSWYYEKGH